jgi:hypothetical protein
MVLVDPVATSDWKEPSQLHSRMLRRGVLLSRRGGVAFAEQIVGEIRKLPPEVWPMIRSHWSDPK